MSVVPKKSLGQHWLYDADTLQAIADMAEVTNHDYILEIGPGLGTLTEVLLSQGAQVMAVELDRELYEQLQKPGVFYTEDAKRLTIVNQDILKFDLTQLPPDYKVIANIPYYLTSNLIRVLSETTNPPLSATLLIQKEVAERLAAGPGDMSILSATAQMYFNPTLGPVVPAEMFTPPPKIDSQVIHLQRRAQPLFGDIDSRALFRVVKAGFSNRRKTLHNSLSAGLHISKDQAATMLEACGIDPRKRPQELSLEEWIKLAKHYV